MPRKWRKFKHDFKHPLSMKNGGMLDVFPIFSCCMIGTKDTPKPAAPIVWCCLRGYGSFSRGADQLSSSFSRSCCCSSRVSTSKTFVCCLFSFHCIPEAWLPRSRKSRCDGPLQPGWAVSEKRHRPYPWTPRRSKRLRIQRPVWLGYQGLNILLLIGKNVSFMFVT